MGWNSKLDRVAKHACLFRRITGRKEVNKMYCPSCGVALSQQLTYCNRCGAQLTPQKDADLVKLFEERMDSEMEGLFWITVFGVGLILGGIALMSKVLHLGEGLIIAYMALSSAAFMAYFGLGVWQVRRLARSSREAKDIVTAGRLDTSELNLHQTPATLPPAPSVTENTTRTLEPVGREGKAGGESAF